MIRSVRFTNGKLYTLSATSSLLFYLWNWKIDLNTAQIQGRILHKSYIDYTISNNITILFRIFFYFFSFFGFFGFLCVTVIVVTWTVFGTHNTNIFFVKWNKIEKSTKLTKWITFDCRVYMWLSVIHPNPLQSMWNEKKIQPHLLTWNVLTDCIVVLLLFFLLLSVVWTQLALEIC